MASASREFMSSVASLTLAWACSWMVLASAALSAAICSWRAYSSLDAWSSSRSVFVSSTMSASFSFIRLSRSQFCVNSANDVAPRTKSRNVEEPERYMSRARTDSLSCRSAICSFVSSILTCSASMAAFAASRSSTAL